MSIRNTHPLTLYAASGQRKYLTSDERARFMTEALAHPRREVGTLCLILVYTGCRLSEALSLTTASIEVQSGYVAIRSLKKRTKTIIVREVPVPDAFIYTLSAVHELNEASSAQRLWPMSRCRAWRLVKDVMAKARIASGPHCTPKGLRHGLGIHAIRSGVPINMVQRWLGHARMETTAIYLQAMGREEREIAERMWMGSDRGLKTAELGTLEEMGFATHR